MSSIVDKPRKAIPEELGLLMAIALALYGLLSRRIARRPGSTARQRRRPSRGRRTCRLRTGPTPFTRARSEDNSLR